MTSETPSSTPGATVETTNFHPVILSQGGRYCVYLAEWNIAGEGDTVDEAYAQFKHKFEAFRLRSAKFDLATVSPDPYPVSPKRGLLIELSLFFAKVLMGALATVVVFVVLLPNIGAAFRNQVTSLVAPEYKDPRFWAIQLPSQVNARLDRLDPGEQEKMLNEWNHLFERTTPLWKPFKCQ